MRGHQIEIIVSKGEDAQLRQLFEDYFSQEKMDEGLKKSLYARAVVHGSTTIRRREGQPPVLIRPKIARWDIYSRDEKEPIGHIKPYRFPGAVRLVFKSLAQSDFVSVYRFSEDVFLQMEKLGFEPSTKQFLTKTQSDIIKVYEELKLQGERVTDVQVGEVLGIRRETVNRHKQKLRARGFEVWSEQNVR